MAKMTETQEHKLEYMMEDIKGGLAEDFEFVDVEQAQDAIDRLKAKVNNLQAKDFIFNDED